jgi:hypothetical protein
MGPARMLASPPLPPRFHHGEDGREKGREGLTGGSHLAVKQEERWVVDGPAGCVGPKGIGGLAV